MTDIYQNYRMLQKNTSGSYWEKRTLSQIRYLLEQKADREDAGRGLLEQALSLLAEDYLENRQINARSAKAAEQLLLPLSEQAKRITLICAAHAHIDMNWLWGYQETVAVTLDTVRTMLTLMKEYPNFTFSQSQASVYQILEEYAPELLKQVKQRVQEGRWEVTASTWVENDKNMPTGEAMARHLLYTKKYLSGLLDIDKDSLNLDFEPDTFGHSANLPEILNRGGVTRYYHCRGYDGENIYRWRGVSGAEVLVYRDPRWYNLTIDYDLCQGVPEFCEKYGIDKVLYVYGVGDHGGGPTRRDIERFLDMNSWPCFPNIRFGTYREYFDYLETKKEQFPMVDHELNYVFTGCYTSQSRIKMANRTGEARLAEAEILESMADMVVPGYQSNGRLEEAWQKILFNQFHDIIPGSGVVETREYAMGEFQKAMARAAANGVFAMDAICAYLSEGSGEKLSDTAQGAGVGNGTGYAGRFGFPTAERGGGPVRYLALFNVTQMVRTDPVEITLWDWQEEEKHTRVTDLEGREYPFQMAEQEAGYWGHTYRRLLVWMPVPAVGYTICRVETKAAEEELAQAVRPDPRTDHITDEPVCLENDKIKAVFDIPTMKCISLIRKSDQTELITADWPACGLELVTEETGNGMTSWRVGRTAACEDLNKICSVRPMKLQTEGLRKELAYEIAREGLKVRAEIHLDQGSEFLEYRLDVEWMLRGNMEQGVPQLRFQLPCGYEVEKYRYAIPYGIIDRAPLDQDVPAVGLGCALGKGKSALCLLADSKYGFRGTKEGLFLNLLRGSYEPDPYPELGAHTIRIAVGACDPDRESLALLAERFIHPVIVRSCGTKIRKTEASKELFHVEGAVLSAIKAAEDGNGLIVRVYDPSGDACTMKLSLPGRKIEAYQCDILENVIEPVPVARKEVLEYTLQGYEVLTLRIVRAKA